MERRAFLKAGAAALLGLGFRPDPTHLVRPPPGRSTVHLRSPLMLRNGDVVENTQFVLGDDFRWDSTSAAVYAQQVSDVTLRNVEIVTTKDHWGVRWNDLVPPPGDGPGIVSSLSAIRISGGTRIELDGVSIRGFPRSGISASGLTESTLRNVRISLCHSGIKIHYAKTTRDCLFERIDVGDTWNGAGGVPSSKRPGESIGGPALALGNLQQCVLRDVSSIGENSGIKLTHPRQVVCSSVHTSTMAVTGDVDPKNPEEPGSMIIEKSRLDKSLGAGHQVDSSNCLQVSFHVSPIIVRDCTFHGAGKDGHGIQLVGHCLADVRECTFIDFNGSRGGLPAHALDLFDGSVINQDFEIANDFHNQPRILQDRSGRI